MGARSRRFKSFYPDQLRKENEMELFFWINGLLVGFGLRIIYNLLTGKDIPLYIFPYITLVNGKIIPIKENKDKIEF